MNKNAVIIKDLCINFNDQSSGLYLVRAHAMVGRQISSNEIKIMLIK